MPAGADSAAWLHTTRSALLHADTQQGSTLSIGTSRFTSVRGHLHASRRCMGTCMHHISAWALACATSVHRHLHPPCHCMGMRAAMLGGCVCVSAIALGDQRERLCSSP
eukprot:361424-Chlamydomonas_euryale.AAC.2